MNHSERLEACISGKPVDRPCVSLWRHFPGDDQRADTLSQAAIHFQKTYDWDFIKVTPGSGYMARAWGIESVWRGNPEGTRDYVSRPLKTPVDWGRITPLSVTEGPLADQIKCIRQIKREFGEAIPIIQTIFAPIGQANKMGGNKTLIAHMRLYPDLVKEKLEIIMNTTINFIQALIDEGIDGIFYAVQLGQYGLISENDFKEFCKPYDLACLEPTKQLWCNVLHLHGEDVMFDQVCDYPVQVINWHDLETPPSLPEGKRKFNGAVCGGLRQWETLAYASPDDVTEQAAAAILSAGPERFILGTGCVVPVVAPHGNLMAVRNSVEDFLS